VSGAVIGWDPDQPERCACGAGGCGRITGAGPLHHLSGLVTLRRRFDLSYAQLSPSARHTFRLLGVVPGPDFTPAVAAALRPDGTDVGDELDRLARAHLLERPALGRYRFHDLLRRYPVERFLAEDDADRRADTDLAAPDWYPAIDTLADLAELPPAAQLHGTLLHIVHSGH
jgi:hypothetical protein